MTAAEDLRRALRKPMTTRESDLGLRHRGTTTRSTPNACGNSRGEIMALTAMFFGRGLDETRSSTPEWKDIIEHGLMSDDAGCRFHGFIENLAHAGMRIDATVAKPS